jgi:MbtH protein
MVRDDAVADDVEDAFLVVRNDEGQYSVWWQDRPVPAGWTSVGPPGPRRACLERIARLWTDARPAGVRVRVAAAEPGTRGRQGDR